MNIKLDDNKLRTQRIYTVIILERMVVITSLTNNYYYDEYSKKEHMCVFSERLRDWHWFALPMQVVFFSNLTYCQHVR